MNYRLRTTLVALSCCLAIGISIAGTSACSAATIIGSPVALSTLLNGGSITSGDKVFTNFTYLFTGDMPGPIGVNVVAIQDSAGNYGIEFQGAFIDLPSSQGGSDAKITYTVTAGPNYLISDAHMEGNPNLLGETGSISVTETFLPLGASGEFLMEIYDDEGHPTPQLVDDTIFTVPTRSINVQKDILAIVPSTASSATISFIDQTFSQIIVPEPSVGLLALWGVLGLAGRRKRS